MAKSFDNLVGPKEMEKIKAKCPYCISGCDKCDDGHQDIGIADGFWYTLKCQNESCGYENGGLISDDAGLSEKPVGKYKNKCVLCGAPTKWLLLGYNDEK